MSTPTMSRWAAGALLSAGAMIPALLASGGAAGAATPAAFVHPSACFSTAQPGDEVAEATSPAGDRVILSCGDYTHGIIHIDSEHPIDEGGADDQSVPECEYKILAYGTGATQFGYWPEATERIR